ncbi:SDR family oxidoreductase [Haloarchaeobius sp. HME9146]|uniref:SDR family oxidoreductase n=1 Tax=Haloarchaeobius sp. HME9146 TaxID=2978732 RepID=UPI0021BE5DE3|nr:SDR family oxidoreductase [Haloarchaeobius sp. HME9146]MCT9094640.1 SDR family oxidoreductase [Haloarchaeobius sp. HME9146]
MDLNLEGETALVTASSSGLGLASAKALAREGANVTICGRDRDRLDAAAEEIENYGFGEVLARPADITDPDDIKDVVETTVEAFGGLDHLVTSAGGPPSGPFLDMTEKDFYAAYDLLVMSAVWTLKEAHPHLAASDSGSWVAITSTSVVEAIDGLVLSNAVRRAVVGLVDTVAREWAPDVRANVVMPGAHETSRIKELIEQSMERGEYDSYEEGLADWSADIPMNRIGDPMELGDVVAFLASEKASFVTGTSLPVDGGRTRS